MNVLLGVTGSVAATLTPQIVAALRTAGHEVQVVATKSSLHFFDPTSLGVRVWRDSDEWADDRYERHQPIVHIELRKWADQLVIAPLSANTLAKIAHGMCDNLLTSIVRAWDRAKPVVLAPAMNTHMWDHPATSEQLAALMRWHANLYVVQPIVKRLACGDDGRGALAAIETIIATVTSPYGLDPFDQSLD